MHVCKLRFINVIKCQQHLTPTIHLLSLFSVFWAKKAAVWLGCIWVTTFQIKCLFFFFLNYNEYIKTQNSKSSFLPFSLIFCFESGPFYSIAIYFFFLISPANGNRWWFKIFFLLLKEDFYSSWLQKKTVEQNISKCCFVFITVFWHYWLVTLFLDEDFFLI